METRKNAKTYLNYIQSEWEASNSNQFITSFNPASKDEVVGYLQRSTKEDLDRAVAAAKKAKVAWWKLAGTTRGDYLLKIAQEMEKREDEIAETMTRESVELQATFGDMKHSSSQSREQRQVAIEFFHSG